MSALTALAFASALLYGAGTASAVSYRYWSYWLGTDAGWTYASWGPASVRPADGSVEGWRFGVSSGTSGAGLQPRAGVDFDRVCSQTPAEEGRKRVAVIIDPGLAEHAPPGEYPGGMWAMCVVAEPSATGADVLRSAASVRTNAGMVCGLAGYPVRECAVIIDSPPGREGAGEGSSSRPTPGAPSTPKPQTPTPQTAKPQTAKPPTPDSPTSGSPASGSPASGPQPRDPRPSSVSSTPRPISDSPILAGPDDPAASADANTDEPPSTTDGESSTAQSPSAPTSGHTPPSASSAASSGEPNPQISIVASPVTAQGSGPQQGGGSGPAMAIIAGMVITVILTVAALRRRALR